MIAAGPHTCTLEVFRFKRGDGGGHFDAFDVPVGPDTTLLDALLHVKHHLDPTLALRHSCLHASCGTCGVIANGREVLGCVTPIRDLGDRVRVEPLENIPVLTDLVCEPAAFFDRFVTDTPPLRLSEFRAGAVAPPDGERFVRYEDCIECGLCLSACPVAATSGDYVGPAALVAAQRLLDEPRGSDPDLVRRCVDTESGAWRCHAAFECSQVCPAGANPAERIMHLRGELLRPRHDRGAHR
jgi:succinate dehydrogenase / fumarate reductase iron-sulfur subunit